MDNQIAIKVLDIADRVMNIAPDVWKVMLRQVDVMTLVYFWFCCLGCAGIATGIILIIYSRKGKHSDTEESMLIGGLMLSVFGFIIAVGFFFKCYVYTHNPAYYAIQLLVK